MRESGQRKAPISLASIVRFSLYAHVFSWD
jgi:hypothetical protein